MWVREVAQWMGTDGEIILGKPKQSWNGHSWHLDLNTLFVTRDWYTGRQDWVWVYNAHFCIWSSRQRQGTWGTVGGSALSQVPVSTGRFTPAQQFIFVTSRFWGAWFKALLILHPHGMELIPPPQTTERLSLLLSPSPVSAIWVSELQESSFPRSQAYPFREHFPFGEVQYTPCTPLVSALQNTTRAIYNNTWHGKQFRSRRYNSARKHVYFADSYSPSLVPWLPLRKQEGKWPTACNSFTSLYGIIWYYF